MKILVTGGAGFIGSNFIRHILNKYPEYKVTNFDKLTYCGNLENLKDIENNPNYKFVKGDICDFNIVNDIVKDCDTIINFAAQTHVDRSITLPEDFIHTNVYGTCVLLESARKHNISKFVHISTDETYGSRQQGSFKEADALRPNNPYAASKAGADLLCGAYFVTHKLPVIITRSSNNFGPYQYPEKVIPLFITNSLKDKKVPLYGDGLNMRDWLFVLDNCAAIDLVLHKGLSGEIYNIASGNEMTNIELTGFILNMMGKPKDLIEYVKDRSGHDRRYSIDCAKIKNLGWQPQYQFEHSLKETIAWYQRNQQWWRKLNS